MSYYQKKGDGPVYAFIMGSLDLFLSLLPGFIAIFMGIKSALKNDWTTAGLCAVLSMPWLIAIGFIIKGSIEIIQESKEKK